jgi:hypothetical protein
MFALPPHRASLLPALRVLKRYILKLPGAGSREKKPMSRNVESKRIVTVGDHPIFGGLVKFLRYSVCPIVQRNPLLWALPLQALLLLSNLDLLDPWNDEWFTLTHVGQSLSEVLFSDPMNPPLYYLLVHYWIQLPWSLSPLASVRVMSVLWTLVATVAVYVLWLRREGPRFQAMFLALWVLSPFLLLHARMARSYSMQLALASLAILSAPRWAEQPRNWKRLLAYAGPSGALLYTHYLSGLAVAVGVFVTFVLKKRFALAAAQVTLLAVLYAPWLPTLVSSLDVWISSPQPHEGGNFISDQIVRLAYLFVSFSFGESFSTLALLLSFVLTPVVLYALWRATAVRPVWFSIVLVTIVIAWVGASRFEPFVLMPSHLMFILPFFLIVMLRQLNRPAFAPLLVLYACADYAYFTKTGFLVKPYAAPYQEMADVIRYGSRGQNALVALDRYGSFTEPLVNRLSGSIRIIFLDNDDSAREMLDAARSGPTGPSVIWLWRRTSDVSPGAFVSKLEQDLSVGQEIRQHEFVAYSLLERWARRLLRGPNQPQYYYQLTEFRPVGEESPP